MISQRVVNSLVVGALLLPIVVLILGAAGRLLTAMADEGGGLFLGRLALAAGVLWVIDLVLLVVALGVNSHGREG